MPICIDTADQPVRDQAGFWQHVVSEAFGPLEMRAEDRADFPARITARTLGPVEVADVRAPAHVVSRAARRVTTDGSEQYKLCLLLRGSGVVEQSGREVEVFPGDLVLYDLTRPIRFTMEAHHLLALTMRQATLPVSPARVGMLTGTILASSRGPGRLAVSFLTALAADGSAAEGPSGPHLGEALVNLVTGAVQERLDGEPAANGAHAELLARIEEWIEGNLHRVDLTPAAVAEAHHISVRQLHRIFQEAGTTVAAHVRARRLDRCRRELAGGEPVGLIAARWGFPDPASFSRAFRRAYGSTPSHHRL
ncbi:AraC-like ligand-binding domain-containing protein [Streptosporangium soli]|nr:helix-turn-helix domain-containing protein [Streptosporangium sp. KLBMP 9127]